jgi:hypothetical protein
MKSAEHQIKKDQSGIISVFAVILVGAILAIGLTLSAIFIPKIKSSAEIKNSSAAAYAAESVLEWCLYINRIVPAAGSIAQPVMSNGAAYINGLTNAGFTESDCSTPAIKAIGTYRGVTRSFQISF